MSSRSVSVASGLASMSTGSPTRYRPPNTRPDMTSTTTSVCSRRRTMVANTGCATRLLGQLHILGQRHLIGPATIAYVVLHGPYGKLELQRQYAVVFHDHVAGLLQQG